MKDFLDIDIEKEEENRQAERLKQYPLYPELSEIGKQETEAIFIKYKKRLKDVMEECLGELYVDIADHIESDSWINFRNTLMNGFRDYSNRKVQGEYNFKEIRTEIYNQFREEIIKDLDKDNLQKIEELQEDNKRLKKLLNEEIRGRY